MYFEQIAVAKHHAQALKDMPAACRPHDLSLHESVWEGLKSVMRLGDDECAQYHEAILVDPILQITPTKVSHFSIL